MKFKLKKLKKIDLKTSSMEMMLAKFCCVLCVLGCTNSKELSRAVGANMPSHSQTAYTSRNGSQQHSEMFGHALHLQDIVSNLGSGQEWPMGNSRLELAQQRKLLICSFFWILLNYMAQIMCHQEKGMSNLFHLISIKQVWVRFH